MFSPIVGDINFYTLLELFKTGYLKLGDNVPNKSDYYNDVRRMRQKLYKK